MIESNAISLIFKDFSKSFDKMFAGITIGLCVSLFSLIHGSSVSLENDELNLIPIVLRRQLEKMSRFHEELEKNFRRRDFSSGEVVMAAKTKLTDEEAQQIVDMHNKVRQQTGGSNVMKMVWDDELASLAQGLTDSCKYGHADYFLPNGVEVGQNIALASGGSLATYKLLEYSWANFEKPKYNIKSGLCEGGHCGHYTQMVWSSSDKVGCGATVCPNLGLMVACDYKPTGNFFGKHAFDTDGSPCSKCNLEPGTACDNGLCVKCDPEKDDNCRPYDCDMNVEKIPESPVAACIDLAGNGVKDCNKMKPYCSNPLFMSILKIQCTKTCGFCAT